MKTSQCYVVHWGREKWHNVRKRREEKICADWQLIHIQSLTWVSPAARSSVCSRQQTFGVSMIPGIKVLEDSLHAAALQQDHGAPCQPLAVEVSPSQSNSRVIPESAKLPSGSNTFNSSEARCCPARPAQTNTTKHIPALTHNSDIYITCTHYALWEPY